MNRNKLLVFVLALVLLTSVSAAVFTIEEGRFFDGFESGDLSNYDSSTGPIAPNNSFAKTGNWSMRIDPIDSGHEDIRTNENFNLTNSTAYRIQFDAKVNQDKLDDNDPDAPQGVLVFLESTGLNNAEVKIFLGNGGQAGVADWDLQGNVSKDPTVNITDTDWHSFEMVIDRQASTVTVSIDGNQEVETGNLVNLSKGPLKVGFVTNEGQVGGNQTVWVDNVEVLGSEFSAGESLTLTPETTYLSQGEKTSYTASLNITDAFTGANATEDVTDSPNLTVTSSNSTILSVNETSNELIATSDVNLSGEVNVTARFQNDTVDENSTVEIFVGSATADNLKGLPSNVRIEALFNGDKTNRQPGGFSPFALIIVAVIAGIGAANISSAFGGIGAMQFVFLAGWFAGYLGTGLMLVTVFYAVFVGLNLAGNVNMSMRG